VTIADSPVAFVGGPIHGERGHVPGDAPQHWHSLGDGSAVLYSCRDGAVHDIDSVMLQLYAPVGMSEYAVREAALELGLVW